uniref:Uncharacterized protein n=1 Tax=Vitis vinifera TaxID=29760 RepID=F6I5B1_VITVI
MFVWVSGNGDVRVWDCHTGRCVDQGIYKKLYMLCQQKL